MSVLASALLVAQVVCSATTCHYRNDDFFFEVTLPRLPGTTACVANNPGGRHGMLYYFTSNPQCADLTNVPVVSIYSEYETAGAETLGQMRREYKCAGNDTWKIDGLRALYCVEPDTNDGPGWEVLNYLGSRKYKPDLGYSIEVYVYCPKAREEKYLAIARQFITGIRLLPIK